MNMRQILNALLTALAFMGVHVDHADAQSYPSRPITMVVPFAAGGGTDTLGRIVAEGMKASLDQPVIVENLPGAAGSAALSRVSRAAPDGYTVVFGNWATHVVGPATRAVAYDVVKDFVPVSLAATQPLVIVANKSVPANDLQELVAWVKANPDKATVGTAGPGSATHVAALFFQAKTGVRVQLVPYRGGGAQSMQDLIMSILRSPKLPMRFRMCSLARSRLMRSPPVPDWQPHRVFLPSTKLACLDCMSRCGTPSGLPRAPRTQSCASSTVQSPRR
jgi:tripartite-type tricarboxylate transporter receptor subunit TctC